jgi:hypothetical protein
MANLRAATIGVGHCASSLAGSKLSRHTFTDQGIGRLTDAFIAMEQRIPAR